MTALTRSDRDRILAAWDAMVSAYSAIFVTASDLSFARYDEACRNFFNVAPLGAVGASFVADGR